MKDIIDHVDLHEKTVKILKSNKILLKKIKLSADLIFKTLSSKKKILIAGNGGSAADSQHIAAEFIGKLNYKRKSLAAIALTTDTSIITSIANDYGYNNVFSRQIEGIGEKGDLFLAISTSGQSANIIKALKFSKKVKIQTIAFTGKEKNQLSQLSNICINIPSSNTQVIQEIHIMIAHIICSIVELKFKNYS